MLDLNPLLTTVAQVSFTIVGLMLVAVAGDNDTRRFWLGESSRAIYVTITLLVILLPGCLSIGGLILPLPREPDGPIRVFIPSYAIATIVAGLAYLWILHLTRTLEGSVLKEVLKLDDKLSIVNMLKPLGWAFVLTGGCAALQSAVSPNPFLNTVNGSIFGCFLLISMLVSSVAVISFVRFEYVQKGSFAEGTLSRVQIPPNTNTARTNAEFRHTIEHVVIAGLLLLLAITFVTRGRER